MSNPQSPTPESNPVLSSVLYLDLVALEDRILYSAAPVPAEMADPIEATETVEQLELAESIDANFDFVSKGLDCLLTEGVIDGVFDVDSGIDQLPSVDKAQSVELVVVDKTVEDYQTLLDGILHQGKNVKVFFVDPDADGVKQLGEFLEESATTFDSMHIVTHGDDGVLQLGNTLLSGDNLGEYEADIKDWQSNLSADADMIIYGCEVAETEVGESFVNELADLTGADVAASSDLTGYEALGGNWEFEYTVGLVDTEVVFSVDARSAWQNTLILYDSTSEGGGTWNTSNGAVELDGTTNSIGADNSGNVVYVTSTDDASIAVDGSDIVLRRVDIDGNESSIIIVNNDEAGDVTAGDQKWASVAVADNGNHVVTWTSEDAGGNQSVWATVYAGDGSIIKSDFQVDVDALGGNDAEVAIDSEGNFVVVWEAANGSDDAIYAQKFDPKGNADGSTFLVNDQALFASSPDTSLDASDYNDDFGNPAVSMNDSGDIVITWDSYESDKIGEQSGIYARLINSTHDVIFKVVNNGVNWGPSVDMNESGHFAIFYTADGTQTLKESIIGDIADDLATGITGNIFEIKPGMALGFEAISNLPITMHVTYDGEQYNPQVAMFENNRVMLTWEGRGSDGYDDGSGSGTGTDNQGVYKTFLDFDGNEILEDGTPLGTFEDNYEPLIPGAVFDPTPGGDIAPVGIGSAIYDEQTSVAVATYHGGTEYVAGFTGISWETGAADDDYHWVRSQTYHDLPEGQDKSLGAIPEDTRYVMSTFDFTYSDNDGDDLFGIRIDAVPTNGTLLLNGIAVEAGRTIHVENINAGSLIYVPDTNYSGTDTMQFSVKNSHQTSASSNTLTFNITPVAEANYIAAGDELVSIDGAELVNDTFEGNQIGQRITALEGGGHAVVWYGNDGSGPEVFLKLYDASGNEVFTEELVDEDRPGTQTQPDIVGLADGGFVVVWTQQDGPNSNVFAQIYDDFGNKLDENRVVVGSNSEFPIATLGGSEDPRVAALSDGGFVVSWSTSSAAVDANGGIAARIFDAHGNSSRQFLVSENPGNETFESSIVGLDDNRFAISWLDKTTNETKLRVFDAGEPDSGTELILNGSTAERVELEALSNGNFVAIYHETGGDSSGKAVMAEIFDSAGSSITLSSFQVNTEEDGHQENPTVVALPDGGFMAIWESQNMDADGHAIVSQRFAGDGGKIGGESVVFTHQYGNQGEPQAAILSNGEIAIVWNDADGDNHGSSFGTGIFIDRFNLGTTGVEDQVIDLNLDDNLHDDDTSESIIHIQLNNIPIGASVVDDLGNQSDPTLDSQDITGWDLSSLKFRPAPNSIETVHLAFEVTTQDGTSFATNTQTVTIDVEHESDLAPTPDLIVNSADTTADISTSELTSWIVDPDVTPTTHTAVSGFDQSTISDTVGPGNEYHWGNVNGGEKLYLDATAVTYVSDSGSQIQGLNNVYEFDGSGGGQIDDAAFLDFTTGGAIEIWLKPTSLTGKHVIMDWSDTNGGMVLYQDGDSVVLEVFDGNVSNAESVRLIASGLDNTEFNQIMFAVDSNYSSFVSGQGGDIQLYLNGELQDQIVNTPFLADGNEWYEETGKIGIGRFDGSSFVDDLPFSGFEGQLGRFEIYNDATAVLEAEARYLNELNAPETILIDGQPYASGTDIQLDGGTGAVVSIDSAGNLTYDPTALAAFKATAAGDTFSDSFDYTITNGEGDTQNVTIQVSVVGVNEEQVLTKNDGITVPEGSVGTLLTTAMLETTDVDNSADEIVYTILNVPTHASVWLNGVDEITGGESFTQDDIDNNRITIRHDGSEPVADKFRFTVNDGHGIAVMADFSIAVSAVNDRPLVVAPVSLTFVEQTDLQISGAGFGVSDPDSGTVGATATLSVTEGVLNVIGGDSGVVVVNNGTANITLSGTTAEIHALLSNSSSGSVSYANSSDSPASTVTLQLTVNDHGGTGVDPGISGDAFSEETTTTTTIAVTQTNDAPDTHGAAAVEMEDVDSVAIVLAGSDVDGTVDGFVLTTLPPNGQLYTDAALTTLAATGTTYPATGESLTLYFDPAGNWNGMSQFGFHAVDDQGLSDGSPAIGTITISAVNDAPILTAPISLAFTEQTDLQISGTGFSVSDVDSGNSNVEAILSVTEGVLNVTVGDSGVMVTNDGTGTVTLVGTTAQLNSLLTNSSSGTVYYANASDTPSTTVNLQLKVNDQGGTGADPGLTGDATSEEATSTITINITAVNDAPETNAASASGNEDANYVAIVLDGSDVDGTVDNFVLTTLPPNGFLYTDAGLSTLVATGTNYAATGESLTLYFDPADNWNGTSQFGFHAVDDQGLSDGSPAVGTITISSVNDTAETDDVIAFGAEDANSVAVVLEGYDVDGTVDEFVLDSLPPDGLLYTDAALTTFAQTGVNYLASGETLTLYFVPSSDWNGNSEFEFSAVDNLGSQDVTPGKATITISAVNDAPDLTAPSVLAFTEQTDLQISGTGFSVSDVDSGSSNVQAVLSVTEGVLNVTVGDSGVVVINNGTGAIALVGTSSQIDSLLTNTSSGSVFYANASDTPSLTVDLQMTVNDQGGTGADPGNSGDATSEESTATTTINVTSVNDAPITDTPAALTYSEDVASVPIVLTGSDVDGTVDFFVLTTLPPNGLLYTDAGLTNLATDLVPYSASGESLSLYFVPDKHWNGQSQFAFKTIDDLGMEDSTPATATIRILPVEDAPVAENDSYTVVENDSIDSATDTNIANLLDNDTDVDGDLLKVVEYTDPQNGTVTVGPNGEFTYQPDPDFVGSDSFHYIVSDQVDGLVHHWGLGDDATDFIGGANGIVEGTTAVAGTNGDGMAFDEVDDAVQIAGVNNTGSFTLRLDFKIDDISGNAFQYLYSQGSLQTANSLNIYVGESGSTGAGILKTGIFDGSDGLGGASLGSLNVDINALIGDSQWHTYTLVVEDGVGAKVYVDGILQNSSNNGAGTIALASDVYLGARNDGEASRFFGGALDTIQIFDRAFTDAEATEPTSDFAEATVDITVDPVNTGPRAFDNVYSVGHGSTTTFGVEEGLLYNDSDMDGEALTASFNDIAVDVVPQYGNVVVNDDGTFTYVHDPANNATQDTFTYTVADASGNIAHATVTVYIDECGLIDTGEFQVNQASDASPNSPDTNVQDTSQENQYADSAVAIAANGDYVVTWTGYTDSGELEVFARRFDFSGHPLGDQLNVSAGLPQGNNHSANVAMATDGSFVIVWSNEFDTASEDGTDSSIYFQRFNADGSTNGTTIRATNDYYSVNSQINADISMNDNGDFAISWSGANDGGNQSDIHVNVFDSDGVSKTGSVVMTIDNFDGGLEKNPSIALANDGRVFAFWDDGSTLHTRALNSDNGILSSELRIPLNSLDALEIRHSSLDVNNASTHLALAYEVRVDDGAGGSSWETQLQIVDISNPLLFVQSPGSQTFVNDQVNASVSFAEDDTVVLTWQGTGTVAGNEDVDGVFGRKFRFQTTGGFSYAQAISDEFLINQTTTDSQHGASVAALDSQNFVVVWSGNGDGDDSGVFARQYGNQESFEVSGRVLEDTNADANVSNDGANGLAGVEVVVYKDIDGDNAISAADLVVRQGVTDSDGNYTFTGLKDGETYWVVVNSKSITPLAGVNVADFTANDAWAEQTYQEGSHKFGGHDALRSDDASSLLTAEHFSQIDVNDGNVSNIDFGFSFNVVTNLEGADGSDQTGRSIQGSLRQFVSNANVVFGQNEMHFVPVVGTNRDDGVNTWWDLDLEASLPTIVDGETIIDGRAYSFTDHVNSIDSNAGSLGYVGSVGTGSSTLDGVEAPELEISDAMGVANGFTVDASSVTIRYIAINGFGGASNQSANIMVLADGDDVHIHDTVLGSTADLFEEPATAANSNFNIFVDGADSGLIEGNLIGYAGLGGIKISGDGDIAENWEILGNEIVSNASENTAQDGIDLVSGTPNIVVAGNMISGNAGFGIDTWMNSGGYTITDNTITSNGHGGNDTGGVRLFGQGSLVQHNLIASNEGAGVLVVGDYDNGTQVITAASGHLISQNSFYANGGVSIDLLGATDTRATLNQGDGSTTNDGSGPDLTAGNAGFDHPVLTDAYIGTDGLHVFGTLDPNASVEMVELYVADPGIDGSDYNPDTEFNHGEGSIFLGTIDGSTLPPPIYDPVTGEFEVILQAPADGSGNWPSQLLSGGTVTAISVENGTLNTSEFSNEIELNDVPVVDASMVSAIEDTTYVFDVSDFEVTDDRDYRRIRIMTLPTNGTLYLGTDAITEPTPIRRVDIENGLLTFVPADDYNGTTTFEFRAHDGIFQSNSAAVMTIDIAPVNDKPIAFDDSYQVDEDQTLTVNGSGVLVNDTDVDLDYEGDMLTATETMPAQNGTVTLLSDGSFTYVPNADFNGIDRFEYEVKDSAGETSISRVTITVVAVNDNPEITSTATISIDEGTTSVISLTSEDIDGGTPQYFLTGGGDDAALFQLNQTTGLLEFKDPPRFDSPGDVGLNNVYEVEVRVEDGNGGFFNQMIEVTIDNVFAAPEFTSPNAFNVAENSDPNLPVTYTDSDNAVVVLTLEPVGDAAYFDFNPVTGLSFKLPPDFENPLDADLDNTYSVTIKATDADNLETFHTIDITVTPENDNRPVFTSLDTYSVDEHTSIVMPLTSVDADDPVQTVTYSIVGGADQDFFTINTDGDLELVEDVNFEALADGDGNNIYEVEVLADDGNGLTEVQTVKLEVQDVEEATNVNDDYYSTTANQPIVIDPLVLLQNDWDVDSSDLEVVLVGDPALVEVVNGEFVFTPDPTLPGIISFEYVVVADGVTSERASVFVNVMEVPSPPIDVEIDTDNGIEEDTTEIDIEEDLTEISGEGAPEGPLQETNNPGVDLSPAKNNGYTDKGADTLQSSARTIENNDEGVLLNLDGYQATYVFADESVEVNLNSGSTLSTVVASSVSALSTFDPAILTVFWDEMDSAKREFLLKFDVGESEIVWQATGFFAAGSLAWILRGGLLLTTFMTTSPILGGFDVLPVIEGGIDEEDQDDKSISEMVDN